jgi:hypothetical protein
MQKFTFLLILFYSSWVIAIAQNASITNNNPVSTGKNYAGRIPLSRIISSGNAPETGWNIIFSKIEDEGEGEGNEKLEKIKNSYSPKKSNSTQGNRAEQSNSVNLVTGNQFDTNLFDGTFPPDNTAAISKEGYIVSVVNSNIGFYDTTGNVKQYEPIDSFVNDTSLKDVIYDPDIIYDSDDGRFCFVEACGTSSATTCLLLFISKTANPLDGWYYYKISVTKNAPGEWADYPKVAVSDSSLYITANIITSNGNFDQSVIYQADKNSLLNGGTLNYLYWNNIDDNQGNPPFTLIPATSGIAGNYGHDMYFTSVSDGSGSDKIQVFYVTNNINSSPQIISFHVDVDAFQIGSDAVQPGANTPQLDIGDCRIKKAFYLNGIIHCVFTVLDDNSSAGYNGVMYARINTSDQSVQSQIFGMGDRDIAYPSLASIGLNDNDKSVVIFYDESGASVYPGTAAISCDDGMNFGNPITIKQGVAAIKIDQNPIERWGDYSSVFRNTAQTKPNVWGFGIYGTQNGVYGNNICELWNTSKNDSTGANENSIIVFPNPSSVNDTFKINNAEPLVASFDLYDPLGRLVIHLANEQMQEGIYQFSFSERMLASGLYFLVISSGNKIIENRKIVVQR